MSALLEDDDRRRHRNVRFDDLPKWLQKVMVQFQHDWPELATKKGAYGRCHFMSGMFIEVIHDYLRIHREIVRPRPMRILSVTNDPFYYRFFRGDVNQHHVALIKDFKIDWTARQFSARLSFPRIWK